MTNLEMLNDLKDTYKAYMSVNNKGTHWEIVFKSNLLNCYHKTKGLTRHEAVNKMITLIRKEIVVC